MLPTSERKRTLACSTLSIKEGKTPASYSAEGAEKAESMSVDKLKEDCKEPIKK